MGDTGSDRGLIWPAVLVVVLLVSGFVVLESVGHDTAAYVLFISGPLVSSVVGLVIARRVAAVKTVTDTVAHQTNSLLSSRLTGIEGSLSEAKLDRDTIAMGGPPTTPPQVSGPGLMG